MGKKKEDFDFSDIDNDFIKNNIALVKYALRDFNWVKDWDDVIQEAYIWLLMAKKKWNPKKSAWVTFASKYILWKYHIYRSMEKAQYKSPAFAGLSVCSLDKISETRQIGSNDNFEEDLYIDLIKDSILDRIKNPRSKDIVKLVLLGYKHWEIARKYGLSKQRIQQIYNIEINKIRKEIEKMKKMTVYIVGPMAGLPNLNKESFDNAENYISMQGHIPINPHKLTMHLINPSYEECIKIDLTELLKCDAIHMLNGWKDSKGALLEHAVAKAIGLKII